MKLKDLKGALFFLPLVIALSVGCAQDDEPTPPAEEPLRAHENWIDTPGNWSDLVFYCEGPNRVYIISRGVAVAPNDPRCTETQTSSTVIERP